MSGSATLRRQPSIPRASPGPRPVGVHRHGRGELVTMPAAVRPRSRLRRASASSYAGCCRGETGPDRRPRDDRPARGHGVVGRHDDHGARARTARRSTIDRAHIVSGKPVPPRPSARLRVAAERGRAPRRTASWPAVETRAARRLAAAGLGRLQRPRQLGAARRRPRACRGRTRSTRSLRVLRRPRPAGVGPGRRRLRRAATAPRTPAG